MNDALEKEICENTIEDNENDYTGDNIDEAFKEHVIEVVAGLLKSSDLAIPDIHNTSTI